MRSLIGEVAKDPECAHSSDREPNPNVPHPVFWTRGRPKHRAALRLSFSRARAGVRYLCRWRSQPFSDRMGKLNARITNDNELGRGFQIGHSYFVPGKDDRPSETWYQHIVDTQIAPLLREYWFDSPEDVEKAVGKLTADA